MIDVRNWKQTSDRSVSCQVASEAGMTQLGALIARQLAAGDVVALIGELGAGKTRLVKAVAMSLGVPVEEVNSPTFTLIHEYEGRTLIRHCDTYRLKRPDEFADLGLDELFASDGIAFVEWADRVEPDLPTDRLVVRLAIDGLESRSIEIFSTGTRSGEILSRIYSNAGFAGESNSITA